MAANRTRGARFSGDALRDWFHFDWWSDPVITLFRGFATVVGSSVAFGVAGGLIGYGLARVIPDYYVSVLRDGETPGFNAVHAGVGLGTSQGLIAGLVVGAVVVLAVAISERGKLKPAVRAGEF